MDPSLRVHSRESGTLRASGCDTTPEAQPLRQVNEMAPRLERIERLLEKIAPMAVQMPQVISSLTPLGGGAPGGGCALPR